MSIQTKEQTIGYIIKAAMSTSIPAKKILDIVTAALEMIEDDRSDIWNSDAIELGEMVTAEILSKDEQKELRSEMYRAFDVENLREAGSIFKGFIMLYPLLARDFNTSVKFEYIL